MTTNVTNPRRVFPQIHSGLFPVCRNASGRRSTNAAPSMLPAPKLVRTPRILLRVSGLSVSVKAPTSETTLSSATADSVQSSCDFMLAILQGQGRNHLQPESATFNDT